MTKFFTREGTEFELAVCAGAITVEHEGRIYDREPHHRQGRFGVVFVERGAPKTWLLEFRIREVMDAKAKAHAAREQAIWEQEVA